MVCSSRTLHDTSCACVHANSLQSCLTLCNPIDCSPPGPSVHGVLQPRTLEWVAISFSKRNYRKKGKSLSCVRFFATPWTVACQAPPSMGFSRQEYRNGVGCHFLLQGLFPTQGLSPGLPHCRWILYQLSHQGSHYIHDIH